jgi:hypothetical protein
MSAADGVAEAVAGAVDEGTTKDQPRRDAPVGTASPFGGVELSGMGAHHGEWGFQTMSHRKAVRAKTTKPDLKLLYSRYTEEGLETCAGCSGRCESSPDQWIPWSPPSVTGTVCDHPKDR